MDSKWFVYYVEMCSPVLKAFPSKEEAMKFIANFKLKYQNKLNEPDCWVDLIFEGNLVFSDKEVNSK